MVACFLEVVFSLQLVNFFMFIVNSNFKCTPLTTSPQTLLPLLLHCKKYSKFFSFFFSNIAHIDSSNVFIVTYKSMCDFVIFFHFFLNKVKKIFLVKLFGIFKITLSHPLPFFSHSSILDNG